MVCDADHVLIWLTQDKLVNAVANFCGQIQKSETISLILGDGGHSALSICTPTRLYDGPWNGVAIFVKVALVVLIFDGRWAALTTAFGYDSGNRFAVRCCFRDFLRMKIELLAALLSEAWLRCLLLPRNQW